MRCPICGRDVNVNGSNIYDTRIADTAYTVEHKPGETLVKRAFWCPSCVNATLLDTDGRVWYICANRSKRTGFLVELTYI